MKRVYKKYLLTISALVVIGVCDIASGLSQAEIFLVAHQRQDAHRELINSLLDKLPDKSAAYIKVVSLSEFKRTALNSQSKAGPDLIITVGTNVTEEVAVLGLRTPVLSVAIPMISYDELTRRYRQDISAGRRGPLSAIYLDQPLERRLGLVKQILPRAKRIGVALGPGTLAYENEIRSAVEQLQYELQIGKVVEEKDLIDTLDMIFDRSDVMLGMVDPLVFSRASARNILLTAYRWRVPLIGISPAYVRAGALAAVYSSPSQIGVQLSETVEGFLNDDKNTMPAPQFPKYFSVSVNYQVAESMGLQVEDERSLERKLSGMKGGLP